MVTLDSLLKDIAEEVTSKDVVQAQANLKNAQSDENTRMIWRMYAADPFEEETVTPVTKEEK